MLSNDELESILVKVIETHPSLENKKELVDALTKVFDKFETYEDLALEHQYQCILDEMNQNKE